MWGLEGLQEYLTSRPIDDSDAELTSLLKHVRGLNPSGNVSDDFSILRIEL
jgi:hypothetical protein